MISIKNQKEIDLMIEGGKKHKELQHRISDYIIDGVSTYEIELKAVEICKELKVIPAQIGYLGYKYATCIGINDDAEHCIPKKDKIIRNGDIVTFDTTILLNGYHVDGGFTKTIGTVDKNSLRLVNTTNMALDAAINACIRGNTINDISNAIFTVAKFAGYSVLKEYTGHGIGKKIHEDPYIFNYPHKGISPVIKDGMAFALDTMVAEGSGELYMLEDGWSTKTVDGKKFAFAEKTVIIRGDNPIILN